MTGAPRAGAVSFEFLTKDTQKQKNPNSEIASQHPKSPQTSKEDKACISSQPERPDESGGENSKVRALRMVFLRNALLKYHQR
jgi:hypothetical protein